MEGVYPVIINDEVCGKLKVEKVGAYTRFIVECPMSPEVIRLSVYGEGVEGYLGVPLPSEGLLRLDKKLSPVSMRAFPRSIDHCGLAGETRPEKAEEEAPKAEEKIAPVEPEAQCEEASDDEEGPFWYATTDGALVSRDGESEMVALPAGDERVPENIPGQHRIIEGKEYLVYITK